MTYTLPFSATITPAGTEEPETVLHIGVRNPPASGQGQTDMLELKTIHSPELTELETSGVHAPARSVNQVLKRLYAHFTGNAIPEGHPLSGIANMIPVVDRDAEIILLSEIHSIWIKHYILVASDGHVLMDQNTYLTSQWDPEASLYRALLLGGKRIILEPRKRMTVEDFIQESGLHFTLSQREHIPIEEERQQNE